MKMIFGGYGYSYQSPNSPTSPTRTSAWGSAYSPFRNTNMPLQDISMDQTLPPVNGTNARSPPTGGVSGIALGIGAGGRTMKEYEDQLETLKKENFNLKLRIYFLEERMGIPSADADAIKKNIELKVEIESLKKELIEKQELLNQAAKAFELIEEQKKVSSRNQEEYQDALQKERRKIEQLEKELNDYKAKLNDTSTFYQESLGITPEKALEDREKLHQMEEVVASLEAEIKQVTASLTEECSWAQELEIERDQFRDRLEAEIKLREKLSSERDCEIKDLRERVKELEEEAFKRETIVQQQKNEIAEKDRLVKENALLLEESRRTCEGVGSVAEKRKKQIVQLRLSVKTRDDALADLNNKHRALLTQFEQNHARRISSPPSSPCNLTPNLVTTIQYQESQSPTMNHKSSCARSSSMSAGETAGNMDIAVLGKEIEERDREIMRQEEAKKQLVLKLSNVNKSVKVTEEKHKVLKSEYVKALKLIRRLLSLQKSLENDQHKKDRKITDLELEIIKITSALERAKVKRQDQASSTRRELSSEIATRPERDQSDQQRFEEMESKINELRDQIVSVKAEKNRLEKKIQADSEILEEQLHEKEEKIERLEIERSTMRQELREKIHQLDRLKEAYALATGRIDSLESEETLSEREKLKDELISKNIEIDEKNRKIEQLSKDLQIKTQNLQKLVNTELWSKNKEIAKLHNQTMSANQSQTQDASRGNKSEIAQEEKATGKLETLLKELNDVGIRVSFTNDVVQLNYVNGNEAIDVKIMTEYVQKLVNQKRELEREVDYLRWLKLVAQPDVSSNQDMDHCSYSENERARKYCEMLRTHVKDLFKFMKEMLKSAHYPEGISNDHRNIVLDVLVSSKTLYEDFVKTQEGGILWDDIIDDAKTTRRSLSAERVSKEGGSKPPGSEAQSDSEAFSEPDRKVSLARIGLQEAHKSLKSSNRTRLSKYSRTFSDSEDSIDFVPSYRSNYQIDLNTETESSQQIQQLIETNRLLSTELRTLRDEIVSKISLDNNIDEKLATVIVKLEKSDKLNERLQGSLERRINEWNSVKSESKYSSSRKVQLEKKITDVENMALEMAKQKSELLHYKEDTERKAAEMLITLNKENEALRSRIKLLEEENEVAKSNVSTLTKDLDHLTLSHSQVLVENTKLTNDKLRLEQEVRKSENKYEMTVRSLQDKFSKEVTDLNQMNDSHRARLEDLETTNKELRRHVVVCEASDSAPSSSGVSSIPADANHKQTCDDLLQEYHTYNGSQYWLPINYPTSTGRSKSSCSPDLGIESDAAVSTTRPLQDTLKITESMTNLLSDEDYNSNTHRGLRDSDRDSPLHLEGLDEVEALKQENEVLKRRLMKTRRALEDTFQHLSASNKNKKNVEKAITKQLMMTKNILKKTRTYEEPFD